MHQTIQNLQSSCEIHNLNAFAIIVREPLSGNHTLIVHVLFYN